MALSSFSPPDADIPPWNWNPAATFITAYTTMQENQRAQEKAGMEAELSRILLPEKAAQAEFNLKQLAYESKLLEKSYNAQSADYDERMRVISGGGGGADADSSDPTDGSKRSDVVDISGFNIPTANRPTTSGKVKLPDDL
jgi:hypothetical protein